MLDDKQESSMVPEDIVNENGERIGRAVRFKPSDRRIWDLFNDWKQGRLDPSPDFQRGYVWDNRQASKLVESILLGVPIPYIYTALDPYSAELVIDGKQRLVSLFRFLDSEFALVGLEQFPELNRKRYKAIPRSYQMKVEATPLPVVTIFPPPDADPQVKFDVFERINTGAATLRDQELRNSVYRGPFNDFINECGQDELFLRLFYSKKRKPGKRMEPAENALRFFAFIDSFSSYTEPMRMFLSSYMEREQIRFMQMSEEERGTALQNKRRQFRKTLEITQSVFGENSFRNCFYDAKDERGVKWGTVPHKRVYDTVMYGFSKYEKHQVQPHLDAIREVFIDLSLNDRDFMRNAGTFKKPAVQYRFDRWCGELASIIGSDVQSRTFSLGLKRQLFETSSQCSLCSQNIMTLDDAEVDHVEAYWRGGKTIPENAALVHRFCNRAKAGR